MSLDESARGAAATAPPRLRGGAALLFAVTFAALFAALYGAVLRPMLVRGRAAAEPPRLGPVPAFSFAAHDGSTLTERDLRGTVWVADFVFLRCGSTCPIMTASLAGLARTLAADAPAVRFVSFDVDPEHDSLSDLAAFAKETGAMAPRWLFLHGKDRATIRSVSREGFHLGIDDGGPGDTEPILHSTRFVLVDRGGEVRGTYDGTDPAAVATLARDAKRLAAAR